MQAAQDSKVAQFAVGYVGRLLASYPQHAGRLNAWLDRLEDRAPEVAYQVARQHMKPVGL